MKVNYGCLRLRIGLRGYEVRVKEIGTGTGSVIGIETGSGNGIGIGIETETERGTETETETERGQGTKIGTEKGTEKGRRRRTVKGNGNGTEKGIGTVIGFGIVLLRSTLALLDPSNGIGGIGRAGGRENARGIERPTERKNANERGTLVPP